MNAASLLHFALSGPLPAIAHTDTIVLILFILGVSAAVFAILRQ